VEETPLILVVRADSGKAADQDGLPLGAFDPLRHRTFEIGLRDWVEEQTALKLGYVEQLYTFGDRGRHAREGDVGHVVSVGYLALTRKAGQPNAALTRAGARWRPWYDYFPWEDWRAGEPPPIVAEAILPAMRAWERADPSAAPPGRALGRRHRFRLAFGVGSTQWDEERALDRYELLYEAGCVFEAQRDGRVPEDASPAPLGIPMRHDHRRILATAISRLRSKLKYRPVVFELMAPEFTLTELQRIGGGDRRPPYSQAELPTPRHGGAAGRADRRHQRRHRRTARGALRRREVLQERPGAGLRFAEARLMGVGPSPSEAARRGRTEQGSSSALRAPCWPKWRRSLPVPPDSSSRQARLPTPRGMMAAIRMASATKSRRHWPTSNEPSAAVSAMPRHLSSSPSAAAPGYRCRGWRERC
jgi:hypothetical protein